MHKLTDEHWMNLALSLARLAGSKGEVPVGAVIVREGLLLSTGSNLRETNQQALAHAELVAIEKACRHLNSWRLADCDLYVTLEPCLMCAGAIYQSRFRRVIFAATDPKAGAVQSLYQVGEDARLNHSFAVTAGICAEEASQMLSDFFAKRRKRPNR